MVFTLLFVLERRHFYSLELADHSFPNADTTCHPEPQVDAPLMSNGEIHLNDCLLVILSPFLTLPPLPALVEHAAGVSHAFTYFYRIQLPW